MLLTQPQEAAVSCRQDEGEGLGHAWSCGTEQRSPVPWKCLPVQVVGAVPCNNSYRHIEDFIVFELEKKNVCKRVGLGEAMPLKAGSKGQGSAPLLNSRAAQSYTLAQDHNSQPGLHSAPLETLPASLLHSTSDPAPKSQLATIWRSLSKPFSTVPRTSRYHPEPRTDPKGHHSCSVFKCTGCAAHTEVPRAMVTWQLRADVGQGNSPYLA